MWEIIYAKQAEKDAKKLSAAGLKKKAEEILAVLEENPYTNPPRYEKLVGDLSGIYTRRINVKHRLLYEVDQERRIVKILRMWSHYE